MTATSSDTARSGDDSILPFQLDRSQMRGRVVRLDGTLERIIAQHRYPMPVSALVAEAAMLTALIGPMVKLRWRFSLQIRGEGPVHLIATDYFAPERAGEPARLRAYAGFDRGDVASTRGTPYSLIGRGVFGVTIDQGPDMRPYQGLTPLAGGSIAASAETYFAQSEQLATRFAVAGAHAQTPGEPPGWRAGGLMLQQLPATGGHAPAGREEPEEPTGPEGLMSAEDVAAMAGPAREEDWARIGHLTETVEEHELIGPHLSPEGLLYRLFHEERPRVFPAQPIRFGCTCSPERVERALAQYSAKDIAHMTTEEGRVTADCQFCSAHYDFDPATLGFEAAERDGD